MVAVGGGGGGGGGSETVHPLQSFKIAAIEV